MTNTIREQVAIKVGIHWNQTSPGELTNAIVDLITRREREAVEGFAEWAEIKGIGNTGKYVGDYFAALQGQKETN